MSTLGIVDVGTNSIKLLVGSLEPGGRFRPVISERDATRAGQKGLTSGTLMRAASDRAIGILRRYAALLRRHRVDRIVAVATSAVRDAKNGRAFVRMVREQIGLPLRVISGLEEARLIYAGVRRLRPLRGAVAMITIGGGSAQIILGDGARVRYRASVPLGCARMSQRFIRHDPPRPEELDALREGVRRVLAPVMRRIRRSRGRQALGCSAMIEQVLAVAASWHRRRGRSGQRGRLSITQPALREFVEWLSGSRAAERLRLPGLDPRRQDLALPTGVVLLAWMEGCHLPALQFAPGSLREGLVADACFTPHHRKPPMLRSAKQRVGGGMCPERAA